MHPVHAIRSSSDSAARKSEIEALVTKLKQNPWGVSPSSIGAVSGRECSCWGREKKKS